MHCYLVYCFDLILCRHYLEQTQMVLLAASYLDDETILSKLPWLTQEEIANILKRKSAEELERYSTKDMEE